MGGLIEPLQDLRGRRRAQFGLADLDVAEITDEVRRRHVVKPERDDVEFPVHRVLVQVDRVVPDGNAGYPGEEVMKPVGLRLGVSLARRRVSGFSRE
jgi:hypothetical protein